MPIYEYRCKKCAHVFEELVARADSPAPQCPQCTSREAEKLMSVPGGIHVVLRKAPALRALRAPPPRAAAADPVRWRPGKQRPALRASDDETGFQNLQLRNRVAHTGIVYYRP